ncbi:hypothetical protein D6C85_02381 [Aureobasidium pullulans]|uniref:Uncharacterized protein n=1 Tax=Aureobasidium pullulans TaxID=5580 RepID=A0A4S9XEL3_AURPU|nr:hypothetical protein D6C85_02381 [Aureobasidium pullulans]
MDSPITNKSSCFFDFLGLPRELRDIIYSLHLSKSGEVGYGGDDGLHVWRTVGEPTTKPNIGINLLRVCGQIYDEAVTYAYIDRKWAMGYRYALSPYPGTIRCAQRLSCIPPKTAERVQHLGLDIRTYLYNSGRNFAPVNMGDFSKMKSLHTFELLMFLDCDHKSSQSWLGGGARYRTTPVLIGLVCQILSQIPVHVKKVIWRSSVGVDGDFSLGGELDQDLFEIAKDYKGIKGCSEQTT